MSVSCAHPEVSSTRVRMGRRWFVTNVSPTAAASFMNHARLASIAIHSDVSRALNAQASTTCVPWVFTTLMRRPALTRAALPRRAGIVTSSPLIAPAASSRPSRPGWHGQPRIAAELVIDRVRAPALPAQSPDHSPRTAGPQPRDVLWLALSDRSPRTAGPQPRDVLRLAL